MDTACVLDILHDLADTLYDTATGSVSPVLLHWFNDETDEIYLVDLIGGIPRTYEAEDLHTVELEFEEVVKV